MKITNHDNDGGITEAWAFGGGKRNLSLISTISLTKYLLFRNTFIDCHISRDWYQKFYLLNRDVPYSEVAL